MNYKLKKWDHFDTSYMNSFNTEVAIYTPSIFREFRGEIFTTYHSELHPAASKLPASLNFHSRFSVSRKDVLRGMHYDHDTWKLVQATIGDIYLVVLDVRNESPTYGKWENYILSSATRDQVLIPPGFANGHFALTDCIFHYYLFYSGAYNDESSQGTIAYNDPRFDVTWPNESPILQERDKVTREL